MSGRLALFLKNSLPVSRENFGEPRVREQHRAKFGGRRFIEHRLKLSPGRCSSSELAIRRGAFAGLSGNPGGRILRQAEAICVANLMNTRAGALGVVDGLGSPHPIQKAVLLETLQRVDDGLL